jgi:hypothetical protein
MLIYPEKHKKNEKNENSEIANRDEKYIHATTPNLPPSKWDHLWSLSPPVSMILFLSEVHFL